MAPRSFGEYVTVAREKRGYSIRQLAAHVNVAASTVMRIEDGTHAVPHPDLLLALVAALDLDILTAVKLVEPYHRLCTQVMQRAASQGKETSDGLPSATCSGIA